MSLSTTFRLFPTKFPQSLFNPSSPVFKTLTSSHHHHHPVVPLLPSSTPLSFFKSITIQPIPTNSSPVYSTPNSSSSAASASLQSIEELPPKLQEIVKLFQSVQEPKAKYQQLLFYGKGLPPLDPQFKTTENKVQGCVSQVWVRAYLDPENKNVTFEADSDSVLTKGLAALLVNGLSGLPVDAILRVSPDFIVLLGLQQSLTPSRNNGFLNMLNLMQNKAKKLHLQAEMGIGQEFESEKDVKSRDLGSGNDDGVEEVKVGSSSNEGIVNEQQPNSSVLGSRGERIKEILGRELQPVELEVEDLSYQHAGHAGVRGSDGETHFNLKVISKEFEGKSLVKRHRLIYGLLEDELQSGLHALSIVAKTPAEVGG